ncbi:hypothetical protein A7K93_09080 [Candidatus Methylacidiphilum fumarolicum]|uniref:Uncharacterized protein n=2 Tax=Candidatus Methylacidiphilum fumarolicum TaxID=591154 RepID=I0JXK0_METFB|nr:hypothetical protein [Candidatus Methylacidiphilum fumarolicum]MBW6415258.1 hypothetical protein [Candidatus Methylacidiphilum fumarolicum]TFE69239.1 hypothetical protein A7K73_06165 [Candidatus Methylacidiphilum fumarolicum]TFE72237.1 hypothetical protein A7K72_09340 [Candidatus Methylacidiphilum fumarolicum]TFE72378.1 hypothetical protein A7K93_09080 [Candidatus Methylacidiphilum fumarolicum]TFE76965.1 hypothetical protein A7D33_07080 [Candidatus Methylacidiphilum fumarolicum]
MGKTSKEKKKKASFDIRERLLKLLEKAKEKGLPKSRLLPKNHSSEESNKHFNQLIQENKVIKLSERYYLFDYAPSVEKIAGKIEKTLESLFPAEEKPIEYKPISATQLYKKCLNCPKTLFQEALDCLIIDSLLIPLRIGKTRYYLPMALFCKEVKKGTSVINPKKIYKAYEDLLKENKFNNISHVAIASLQKKSGVDLKSLHEWLLEQSRKGLAHLFEGDWALASDIEKQAVMQYEGNKFLRVKLEQPYN